MNRSYYSDTIENFILTKPEEIIGEMALKSKFADEVNQKSACKEEIKTLQNVLLTYEEEESIEKTVGENGRNI